jgi:hypothetical protein
MSRNGVFYAEILNNRQWEPVPKPKFLNGKHIPIDCMMSLCTAYELYALLVGYERWSTYPFWYTEPIVPLSEPRGYPDDMNPIYKECFGYTEYIENNTYEISTGNDTHEMSPMSYAKQHIYLTWFLVQEVVDYDWDRKFPTFTGYVKSQYASLFSALGSFPEDFPDEEKIYMHKGEGRTEISWIQSYREFVGYGDWFIGELLKLGDPKEVRIIFWLDW